MNISKEDVVRTLGLARLEVPESDLPALIAEFGAIVHYVESISAVKLDGVEPLSHGGEARDVFRDDVVVTPLSTKDAMSNAPDSFNGLFRVPRVIAES